MRLFIRAALLALTAMSTAFAADRPCNLNDEANGISVGRPKVFDNRTLTIMLESLSQTLQGMQTQSLDQKALSAALSNIQGTRSSDATSALSIGGVPQTSTHLETIQQTNQVSPTGVALPDGSKTTATTDRAAFTPSAPTLDAVPAFSGFTPTFGSSAGDLLNDQVNLSYQIFNLRMILERSLSDRLLESKPRMQAVLGFNVSLDPPQTAVDSVAEVEITLHSDKQSLSLIALMPQEKTYNSATLSSKSNAFGGTAVVNMIPIGAATRRKSQIFYLYRDNDTIAYERTNVDNPSEVVFGWIFRPVLGRRSVSPGFRQMFAVVGLPIIDVCDNLEHCPTGTLKATVKTQWKKYDVGTLTSFAERDANRKTKFFYNLTFGLTKPKIFEDRYCNTRKYDDVIVRTTADYENSLRPRMTKVTWTAIGAKNALVSISGSNFFTGTQIVLGDKVYGVADGLVLKSNNAMELITPIDALASGSAFISGRYGPAASLVSEEPSFPGMFIRRSDIGASRAGTRTLDVRLETHFGSELTQRMLPRDDAGYGIPPFVTINGNLVVPPYRLYDDSGGVMISGSIPDSFLSGGVNVVKVTWPLFNPRLWSSTQRVEEGASAYQIVRLADKSFLLQSKDDAGFVNRTDQKKTPLSSTQCWLILMGDAPIKLKTANCGSGDEKQSTSINSNTIAITSAGVVPDKLALADPVGFTFVLDVPKASKSDTPAADKTLSVTQFDAVVLEVPVDDALDVGSVKANQLGLDFKPKSLNKGEKVINVQLIRRLTSRPGKVDLIIINKAGKLLKPVRLVIEPCPTCKANED